MTNKSQEEELILKNLVSKLLYGCLMVKKQANMQVKLKSITQEHEPDLKLK